MRRAALACLVVAAAVLTACATTTTSTAKPPAPTRFEINGTLLSVPQDRLQVIRRNWSAESVALAEGSQATASDHQWILDFVALNEALGTTPCQHVALERIDPLPLKAMTAVLGAERHTLTPRKYNEDWRVDACGVPHRWRVMDDGSGTRQELTVMLFPVTAPASAPR